MVRCLVTSVCVAALVLPTIADELKGPKQEAERLVGIWTNEALEKSKAVDVTRLHVSLSPPEFGKDGSVQIGMSIKIWDKDRDGGGGRTVMLLEDKDKWLLSVGSAEEKFKGLPSVLPYRFDGDKLILTVKSGDWKGEYVLKKKW